MQWGTPEDLEDYTFFAKQIGNKFKRQYIDCPNIILMAGRGLRMSSISNVKKPYIKIDGQTLFERCCDNLYSNSTNICAVNGDEQDDKFFEDKAHLHPISVGYTESSVETLKQVIMSSDLAEDGSVLISPSDASIDIDWQAFEQFASSLQIHLLSSSHSLVTRSPNGARMNLGG